MPRTALPALIMMSLLTGCGAGAFSVSACPAPVEYRREFQVKAADELDALPPDSALRGMMADYAQERARLRLCQPK